MRDNCRPTGGSRSLRLAIRLFRPLPYANRCVTSISPWTAPFVPYFTISGGTKHDLIRHVGIIVHVLPKFSIACDNKKTTNGPTEDIFSNA